MIFKHRYFKLDTARKRVFDENGKELALTGNAYRLLVFLCEKKNATLTDINDFFDPAGAKEYTENHVRQYRHKINSLIGRNIVAYKNNIYSIDGPISTEVREQKYPSQQTKWKKFSKKEKWVVSSSIVLLTIYALLVLGGRDRSTEPPSEQSSSAEASAGAGPKPPDDMILIPAGEFLMGSTEQEISETWRQNDGGWEKEDYVSSYPQRKITLPDFHIDKKEVSNGDYEMFVEATKRAAPSLWEDQTLNSQNLPVVGVDWNDANAFCGWLGKRLPTEAEWEKAARGTDGRAWPWGNTWNPTKDSHGKGADGYGFDESDGWKYTAPVGTELGVSPYGVLNMAGNVYEWTADDFNAYPENDKYIQEDFEKGFKALRGGAYDDGISEQRAATRCGFRKDYKDVDVGFRCVRDK